MVLGKIYITRCCEYSMKWFWFSVCMMWVFLPFGMMQEGSIGLCVVGSLAVLNAIKQRPKVQDDKSGFKTWKHYREDTLEEMR